METQTKQVESDLDQFCGEPDGIAERLKLRAAYLWKWWNEILKAQGVTDQQLKNKAVRRSAVESLLERIRLVIESGSPPPSLLATLPLPIYSINDFRHLQRLSEWSTKISEKDKQKQLDAVADAAEKLATALESCAGMDKLAFQLVGRLTEESPLPVTEAYSWAHGKELPKRLRALAKSAKERRIPLPLVTHKKDQGEARKTSWIRAVARYVVPMPSSEREAFGWRGKATDRYEAIAEIVNAMLGDADSIDSEKVRKSLEKRKPKIIQ